MTTSIRPNVSCADFTAANTWSRLVTSSSTGRTASPYCSTRSLRVSVLRAVAATLSPRSRAARTNSRPKPFDAPVMRRGVGEDGAEFGGLLVDGLRAVAGEQAYGRLPGQLRGGDVGRGREGEAGFLDGHVDEVGQSGSFARDARVEEPQREQLADLGDGRDGGGEERVVLHGVGGALRVDALPGGGYCDGCVTDQRDGDAVLPGHVEGFAEPRVVAEVDHGGVTAGGVDEVEVGEGERVGRVAVAADEFQQRVEGALGQLVEAADQFGAELGELRFAVGQ